MSIRYSGILVLVVLMLVGMASVTATAQETAEDLYKSYCWQCHGMEGTGNGVNIRDMSVQPRDHLDSREMSARSDEELFKGIKSGGQAISKSVLMPPWAGVLTDEEIQSLVDYLRQLCQCQHGSITK